MAKHHSPNNGGKRKPSNRKPSRIKVLEARITGLEAALEKFTTVFGQNMVNIREALGMQDANIFVLRYIAIDMSTQSLELLEDGSIDFAHYYKKFNEFLKEQEAKRKADAEAKKKKIVKPVESPPEEFGGDYGANKDGNALTEGTQ